MYIHVKVVPSSRKEEIIENKKDHLEIRVREKPERNMANTRVAELLSQHFGVSVSSVRLINGHHSPSKLFAIADK